MDEDVERFHRLVRSPHESKMVITPDKGFLSEVERLGQDPRKPRTALARMVSRSWLEVAHMEFRNKSDDPILFEKMYAKQQIEKDAHYPASWGLDFIPNPNAIADGSGESNASLGWKRDVFSTVCYTSLTTPKPFDPHLHGDMTSTAVRGFGYHYYSKSPFPDSYDIVHRRGGGPRGGFAFTTGPTEGPYPTSVLPQPQFNLGVLGFSNGGWNPEGLQWTNRPKRMLLQGLRNSWAHKVMFARSRKIMNRNLYGPISETVATPRAPNVVVNGLKPMTGLLSITMTETLNSPSVVDIEVNNTSGRRTGSIKQGDSIQVFASPKQMANPPLLFTGFVAEVIETEKVISVKCLDSLGFLTREVIDTNPIYYQADAATVLKEIIVGSRYAPPVGKIVNESFVILPEGLDFVGSTRMKAVQQILGIINSTPNIFRLRADEHGFISLEKLKVLDDATTIPLKGGEIPRDMNSIQDFYPTSVERESGDSFRFNVVKVKNDDLNISVSVPATNDASYPSAPVEKVIKEDFITTDQQAKMVGEGLLATQGSQLARWQVDGIPTTFNINAGDVMSFASREAGLSGRQRIFNVRWSFTPNGASMTLSCGRQSPDLLATLRLAAGVSS